MLKNKIKRLKSNKYFHFLFVCLIFIGTIYTFDFVTGKILRKYYFTQKSGAQYRTSYSMEKTHAELLVIGASRANHHYVPSIFENGTEFSFYNTGRDGQLLFYQYALLKSVLKRYNPKMVILDFVEEEFIYDQTDYDKISTLLPYYENHPEIRQIVNYKGSFEKIKLLSNIYPFNSSVLTIAMGNSKFSINRNNYNDIQGYVPLSKKWNEPILNINNAIHPPIDTLKIKIFENFIQDCQKANIKLIVVCSPYFYNFKTTPYSIELGKQIASKYHIDFFDFSQSETFKSNSLLFNEPTHLNNDGALVFSNLVMSKIKSFN